MERHPTFMDQKTHTVKRAPLPSGSLDFSAQLLERGPQGCCWVAPLTSSL